MVLIRLTSPYVLLTSSLVTMDESATIWDLKCRIVSLFQSDAPRVSDIGSDINVIYYGRSMGNDEIIRDALNITTVNPANKVFTVHFTVLELGEDNGLEYSVVSTAEWEPLSPAQPINNLRFPMRPRPAAKRDLSLGTWSFDYLQSEEGDGYLVDQLEMSSKLYEITLIDQGVEKVLKIPSQQAIINDTGDHEPYILFTKTALAHINQSFGVPLINFGVQPLEPTLNNDQRGFNYFYRDSRVNRRYRWRRPVGDSYSFSELFGFDWRELPSLAFEYMIRSLQHFYASFITLLRNGGFSRLFYYIQGLLKYFFILWRFETIYQLKTNSPHIFWSLFIICSLLTVLDDTNVNNLTEILNRDLTNVIGRSFILTILNQIKKLKVLLLKFYDQLNLMIIAFIIGNNRPGLILNDHAHEYERGIMSIVSPRPRHWLIQAITILIQDLLCFCVTLIPKMYTVFNYEMIRRVTKAEQELIERESAALHIDINNDSGISHQ